MNKNFTHLYKYLLKIKYIIIFSSISVLIKFYGNDELRTYSYYNSQ